MTQNIAIIMAAGQGSRIGGEVPKQFTLIHGKMLLEYSLDVFENHPRIDDIIVVLPESYLRKEDLLNYLFSHYSKVCQILAGGKERFLSSWNAVQQFEGRKDVNLLLHDAARPGVTPRIINDLLDALKRNRAAVTALPATDTVLQADRFKKMTGTFERQGLYYAQTPQAFRADLLYSSYEALFADGTFLPTDESGVVFRYHPDVKVRIVPGDPDNFKVTVQEDIVRCQIMLANR